MKYASSVLLASILLVACSAQNTEETDTSYEAASAHQHGTETAPQETADIKLGNGENNKIELAGLSRRGPTLIVPSVLTEADSFLVLHPFKDGTPVQTDYVGSTFVLEGRTDNVAIRLDDIPETETPFIIMLHRDVNGDQNFQFGDGVIVPDAPVFEGNILIARATIAQPESGLTPEIIRTSAQEHADKAAAFAERIPYRDDPDMARARALLHRWLAEIEAPKKSIDNVAPLLAPDFVLNFSSGAITDLETLNDWLLGPASSFEATRHVLHDVSVEASEDDTFIVNAQMSWNGLLPDGELMKARTAHRWSVLPNQDGAFQIKRIDVEILERFQFTNWETP